MKNILSYFFDCRGKCTINKITFSNYVSVDVVEVIQGQLHLATLIVIKDYVHKKVSMNGNILTFKFSWNKGNNLVFFFLSFNVAREYESTNNKSSSQLDCCCIYTLCYRIQVPLLIICFF